MVQGQGHTLSGAERATLVEIGLTQIHGENTIDLTDGAASNVFTVTLSNLEAAGGRVTGIIHAEDGTDSQVLSTFAQWTVVRKNSTVTADISSSGGDDSTAVLAGTLTTTGGSNGWDVTTTADSATFTLDANTSLAPSGFHFHFHVECFHPVGTGIVITV